MAMVEHCADIHAERVRYDFLGALQAGWLAFRQRRQERALMLELAQRSPRLLADIGADPETVYAALDGTWDEVDPQAYRAHLPRRSKI